MTNIDHAYIKLREAQMKKPSAQKKRAQRHRHRQFIRELIEELHTESNYGDKDFDGLCDQIFKLNAQALAYRQGRIPKRLQNVD